MSAVVRGCGTRIQGGIYAEVRLSPYGQPLEHFLLCPPKPIDPERMRLSPIGVQIIKDDRTGLVHVLDWIGSTHYPNVADFVEETRRHGVSRRLAKTTPFELLTPGSRLLLVHERAIIADPEPYWAGMGQDDEHARRCPKAQEAHGLTTIASTPPPIHAMPRDPSVMCARLWWEDVEKGDTVLDPDVPYRTVRRTVGGTTYTARRHPDAVEVLGLKVTAYQPGIFASFPISNLAVIRGDGGEHDSALDAARESGLDVRLEDA